MKKSTDVLIEAGYSEGQIFPASDYADRMRYEDEDDRGALMLAHILYDAKTLQENPRAPWGPVCYSEDES